MLPARPFAGRPELSGEPPRRHPDPRWWWATIGRVPGVRAAQAERAGAFGLGTVGDLLLHVPYRYERYGTATPVAQAAVGQEVTVRVELHSIRLAPTRRRGLVTIRALVADPTGRLEAVWFNQRHLLRALVPGDQLMIRGTIGSRNPPLDHGAGIRGAGQRRLGGAAHDGTGPRVCGDRGPSVGTDPRTGRSCTRPGGHRTGAPAGVDPRPARRSCPTPTR